MIYQKVLSSIPDLFQYFYQNYLNFHFTCNLFRITISKYNVLYFIFRSLCINLHTEIERRYPRYGCEDKVFAICHLLHPRQKGTILFKVGLFTPTIEMMIMEEEGPTGEVAALDQAM